MKFKNWIIERLKEKSTWLGITGALATLGVFLSPEQIEAIVSVGVAFASAVSIFWPEVKVIEEEKKDEE